MGEITPDPESSCELSPEEISTLENYKKQLRAINRNIEWEFFEKDLLENDKRNLRLAMSFRDTVLFTANGAEILFSDGVVENPVLMEMPEATYGKTYPENEAILANDGYEMFTLSEIKAWQKRTGKPFLTNYTVESWVKTDFLKGRAMVVARERNNDDSKVENIGTFDFDKPVPANRGARHLMRVEAFQWFKVWQPVA